MRKVVLIDRMNEHQNLAEGKRFSPLLILTLARFGKWDEALSQPKPPADQLFAAAMFHYARGMAHGLEFELRAWTTTLVHRRGKFTSAMNFAIYDKFKEHEIEVPYPQRDIHIRSGTIDLDQGTN